MDWDQIETKWVAMTRRVRADLACAQNRSTVSPKFGTRISDTAANLAKQSSLIVEGDVFSHSSLK